MSAPAFGSIGAKTNFSSNTGTTVAVPSGVASGDLILICGQIEPNGPSQPTLTSTLTATGFTLKYNDTFNNAGNLDYGQFTFWKRATGADTGTYAIAWTAPGSPLFVGTAFALRITGGASSGDPFGPTDHQQGSNPTAYPNTSVSALNDTLCVAFYGCFSSGTLTGPTGTGTWVQRFTDGTTEIALATQGNTAAGTRSATGASWSASDGEMDSRLMTIQADTSSAGGPTVAQISGALGTSFPDAIRSLQQVVPY